LSKTKLTKSCGAEEEEEEEGFSDNAIKTTKISVTRTGIMNLRN